MNAVVNSPPDVMNPQARKMMPEPDMISESEVGERRFRNLYQKSKETRIEAQENLEGYVRAFPMKSVLIATGVGAVLGFLLTRRR